MRTRLTATCTRSATRIGHADLPHDRARADEVVAVGRAAGPHVGVAPEHAEGRGHPEVEDPGPQRERAALQRPGDDADDPRPGRAEERHGGQQDDAGEGDEVATVDWADPTTTSGPRAGPARRGSASMTRPCDVDRPRGEAETQRRDGGDVDARSTTSRDGGPSGRVAEASTVIPQGRSVVPLPVLLDRLATEEADGGAAWAAAGAMRATAARAVAGRWRASWSWMFLSEAVRAPQGGRVPTRRVSHAAGCATIGVSLRASQRPSEAPTRRKATR